MSSPDGYVCPFCGGDAVVGSPCPGCAEKQSRRGKRPPDENKPWHQDEGADGLGLPDDDFDYDDFVAREFGPVPHRRLGVKWYWWALGVLMLALLVWLLSTNRW